MSFHDEAQEGGIFDFLHGAVLGGASSNVRGAHYDDANKELHVAYGPHSDWYRYENVAPDVASGIIGAGSQGGWVWDTLRRRGTKYGHQYAYSKMVVPPVIPTAPGSQGPGILSAFKGVSSFFKGFRGIFGGQHKQFGGEINQLLGSGGDDEPIMAQPGEYVVPKQQAGRYRRILDQIRSGVYPHFAAGGAVGSAAALYELQSLHHGPRSFGALAGAGIGAFTGGLAGAAVGQQVGAALDPAKIMGDIAKAGGDLLKVFTQLPEPATKILEFFKGFVGDVAKFSPASAERFQLALDNLSAAFGKITEPLVDTGRQFADDLNVMVTSASGPLREGMGQVGTAFLDFARETIIPFAQSAMPYFIEAFKAGVEIFKTTFEAGSIIISSVIEGIANLFGARVTTPFEGFRSILNFTIQAVRGLAAAAVAAAQTFQEIARRWSNTNWQQLIWGNSHLFEGMGDFFLRAGDAAFARFSETGRPGRTNPLQGPRTFAARPANQIGIEDIGAQARASAFSQGGNLAERTADASERSAAALVEIIGPTVVQLLQGNVNGAVTQAQNTAQAILRILGGGA